MTLWSTREERSSPQCWHHAYWLKGVGSASKVGISFWSAHFQGFLQPPTYERVLFSRLLLSKLGSNSMKPISQIVKAGVTI
jgi:hypothetical protein